MAFLQRKVGEWSNPVSAEPDRPARTAAEMKAVFDSNANQLKAAFNGLVDDLRAPDAAVQLGSAAIPGIAGGTVWEQLAALKEHADSMGIENGTLVSVNGKIGKDITLTAADLSAANAPVTLAVTLTEQGWQGNGPFTQSVTAAGVNANGLVDVSPLPAHHVAYCECAVRAIGQGEDALTFSAETKPVAALTANVRIWS